MTIVLNRIDDRLIHGQVVVGWGQPLGVKFIVRPAVRFANTANEHHTLMVADPSGNVVEFKWYLQPEFAY